MTEPLTLTVRLLKNESRANAIAYGLPADRAGTVGWSAGNVVLSAGSCGSLYGSSQWDAAFDMSILGPRPKSSIGERPITPNRRIGVALKKGEHSMPKLWISMRSLLRDESGATAIEYGLLAALIALVIVGAVVTVGTALDTTFTNVSTCMTALTAAACP